MESIKEQFEIFKNYKNENKYGLSYLDSASTSLTPKCVVDSMSDYYGKYRSNIERSMFATSVHAEKKYADTRAKIADFIDCESCEILFTSGATDASNKFLEMFLESNTEAKILASVVEHHSVLVPLIESKEKGAKVVFFDEDNFTIQKYIKHILKTKPHLVYMQLASNVTGEIFDVKTVAQAVHSVGGILACDASQAVGHINLSLKDIESDVMFFSAHKMFGPTGTGALFIKKDILDKLTPSIYGGTAVSSVTLGSYVLKKSISRFEPGTQNIAGVIGFGAAVEFIKNIGIENIQKHIKESTYKLEKDLSKIEGIKVYCAKENIGIMSFTVEGVHPHDIEYLLANKGVAVRSGFFCAEPYVRKLANVPMTRVSLHVYTTDEDISNFVLKIKEIISFLKK